MPVVTAALGTLNPVKMIREDKVFFIKLMALALPMALQNLVATSLNMLDTFMIGQLGESAIAAVALSNQIFFLQMLLLFGISSGSAMFTAQFWGKKDLPGLYQSTGLALLLGLLGSGSFTLACQFFPEQIMGFFSKDPEVIRQAIPYLRITSASYMFSAMTIINSGTLRTTGEAKVPLLVSTGAIALNALFNYLLIFGKMGFPALGTTGAAIATSFARTVEMIVLLSILYGRKYPAAFHLKKMGRISAAFIRKYFNRLYPVLVNEIGWSLGITLFTVVYARMGTEVLAAYNVTDTMVRFSFVFFIGTANAAAVVIGNMIGAGEDRAHLQRFAKKILFLSPLAALLFAFILFFLAPYVPLLFQVSPQVRSLITSFMRIFCFVMLAKISNIHVIVGILRSGGDTLFCAVLDLAPLWLMGIPLVALTGLVLQWDPVIVYMVAMSEEVFKYFIGLKRVLSGKWIHNLT
jgi:putative MATE family efflux protein